jgi:hypothetical protein
LLWNHAVRLARLPCPFEGPALCVLHPDSAVVSVNTSTAAVRKATTLFSRATIYTTNSRVPIHCVVYVCLLVVIRAVLVLVPLTEYNAMPRPEY